MNTTDLPPLATPKQAADFLNLKPQSLANWRATGRHGLEFVRLGRSVRYKRESLIEFVNRRTVGAEPTAI